MKRIIFSTEQEKEIVQLYLDGNSLKSLAKRYGTGPSTIAKTLSYCGVIIRSTRPRALSTEQGKEISQLYLNGNSLRTLGKRYGVSSATIANTLSRHGTATRPVQAFSNEQEKEIARQYRAGLCSKELARKYKVDPSTITGVLSRQGVEGRSNHDTHMRCSLNENAFDILTPESAYWAGFLMADGNIFYQKGCKAKLSLGLSAKDRVHVEKFRSFLGSSHKIYYNKKNNSVMLVVSSQEIADALAIYGIIPRKSLIAKVSPALANNRDFWRGEIDGDGTVAIGKDGYPRISLWGSYSLMAQFSRFIRSYEPKRKATVCQRGNIAMVGLHGKCALPILHILYDDAEVSLDRKATKANEIMERFSDSGNKK